MLHPIVKSFIEEETSFIEILKRHKNLDQTSNLLYRLRSTFGTYVDSAPLIAEISKFNYLSLEPNLQFLFLHAVMSIPYFNAENKNAKSSKPFSAIFNRLIKDTHPVIKASHLMFQDLETDWEGTQKTIINEINKNYHISPRYKYYLFAFMQYASQRGQMDIHLDFYQKFLPENDELATFHWVSNKQQTDPFADNQQIFNRIKENPLVSPATRIQTMSENFVTRVRLKEKQYITDEESEISNSLTALKHLVNSNIALLKGDASKALEIFKKNRIHHSDRLRSMTNIRVEIANKNLKTAKLLLATQSEKSLDILNDFYWAQIHLLEGNSALAQAHMAKQNQVNETYNCHNLLDLEYQLAPHLTMAQIRFLSKAETMTFKKNLPEKQLNKAPNDPQPLKILGESPQIIELKETIKKYANLENSVLILGETGTGKELVAKSLHDESSRANKPFLAINCAAILGSILQSELFGHEAGAYTGAQKSHKGIFEFAADGTVFLDEIGDISPEIQVALLRVLEAREVRPLGSTKTIPIKCRIITATNANLQELVKKGRFRQDLYYRLQILEIQTPPLRSRGQDILLLANHFLNNYYSQTIDPVGINPDLETAMKNYAWPGNVRELKNEMEKMRLKNSEKIAYSLEDATFLHKPIPETTQTIATPPEKIDLPKELPQNLQTSDNFLNNKSQYRRLETLKNLFLKHQRISRDEASKILGITSKTIGQDFKQLINEGFIEKIEPTPSPRTHFFILKKMPSV